MNAAIPQAPSSGESPLLLQTRRYLTHRDRGLPATPDLEAAWKGFYDLYAHKIRIYAFTCGAMEAEVSDCVQEVWRELLVRLRTFRLDSRRGQFETWLFSIVQGKTADARRFRKRRLARRDSIRLQALTDAHPRPDRAMEDEEMVAIAWAELRKRLSERTFQVLRLRLLDERPVAEVALRLGLSRQQVWYRYHRARRELVEIGTALARGGPPSPLRADARAEKKENGQETAQGNLVCAVSRSVHGNPLARQGGNRVDYVFQRLELGRRELNPEWMVEWNCEGSPKAVLYIRKMAIVAYAEMCGPADVISNHWPRVVNAAIAAGVAAGIATIIATPTAALPIFQTEFHKHLQSRGGGDETIQVALSAKQEPNGPWCACKD